MKIEIRIVLRGQETWEELWIDDQWHVACPRRIDGNQVAHSIALSLRTTYGFNAAYKLVDARPPDHPPLKVPKPEISKELDRIAQWIRTGDYDPDDARDEIARAIENRSRELTLAGQALKPHVKLAFPAWACTKCFQLSNSDFDGPPACQDGTEHQFIQLAWMVRPTHNEPTMP